MSIPTWDELGVQLCEPEAKFLHADGIVRNLSPSRRVGVSHTRAELETARRRLRVLKELVAGQGQNGH